MDSYLYTLDDDLFEFGDPDPSGLVGDYAESLPDSPYGSTGSDIENHIIYDPQSNTLKPSSSSSSSSFYSSSSSFSFHDPKLPPPHHHPSYPQLPHGGGRGGEGGGGRKLPGQKVVQRTAANIRERRRMKCINEAFEVLRSSIPNDERRLSKVDTLRMAMRYIGYLSDLVRSCDDYRDGGGGGGGGGGGANARKGRRAQEKVIVRCSVAERDMIMGLQGEGRSLLGHSLSWDDPKSCSHPSPDSKLVAKLWMPENPTASDLINLTTSSSDY